MSIGVTIKIILDTRRPKVSGKSPVRIRVTYQRIQKYFPVFAPDDIRSNIYTTDKTKPLDLSPDYFARIYGEKPREDFKHWRNYLDSVEREARNVVSRMAAFNFTEFENALYGKTSKADATSLEGAYNSKIELCFKQGRIGSAKSYVSSLTSLKAYKSPINFADVTPSFLREYQTHMSSEGKSMATIGIYLRNLRAIFNEAIEDGIVRPDAYPFGKGKKRFQIPNKGNMAAPLKQSEIAKIYSHTPSNYAESQARDYWLFSFLLNGANMKDVFSLKFKNIDFHSERITFFRSKTSKTAKEQKPIEVTLTKVMRDIIEKWGNPPGDPEQYVFPVFKKDMTAADQFRTNSNVRKTTQKYMARIAQKLGINKTSIHNYTGRDTFAEAQRIAGETGDVIGEAFGHENRTTTETYLNKFGKEIKDRLADNALRYIGETPPDENQF